MNLKCILGHKWNGCKCERCGETRDQEHRWDGCKCTICGITRDEEHDWDLCKGVCRICGKTQPIQHEMDGCRCKRCGKEQHKWEGNQCIRCGKEAKMLADLQDNHAYHQHITVMENEIIINTIHIPVGDINDIVYQPIKGNLQGLGGWIKFVTKDNPNIPTWKGGTFDDWEVMVNGECKKGYDLFRGNVFRFGCDYVDSYNYNKDEGWERMNEKTAQIVSVAKKLI